MTVLLTGGTGFIGTHVAHALRARDVPVRALVRDPGRAPRLRAWGCELVAGDVTDPASLARACEGADAVVQLVSILNGKPADFERLMAQGTRDLVGAAQAAGVRRFVLASALGLDERSRDAVPYFAAKWEMERAVRESALEHVIFRPSFVFGRDGGALQVFLRLARFAPVTPIVGDGTSRLQPIWVEDVAEFFARSLEQGSGVVELGGPDAVTWDDFWARLKRTTGNRRPSVHVPFGVMRLQAAAMELFPNPPLTRDQLTMLQLGDNVVGDPAPAAAFGVDLVPLDEQLRRAV
ncbi:MAG TPA: NAD(P)H-binding protein [Gaiellaceae bacterium]|nr:NAD(P)H-binding protein [Gaiellaceae bacterium]